jgi:hypothetical protein
MIDNIIEQLEQAVKDGHLAPHMEVNIRSAILSRESAILLLQEEIQRLKRSAPDAEYLNCVPGHDKDCECGRCQMWQTREVKR